MSNDSLDDVIKSLDKRNGDSDMPKKGNNGPIFKSKSVLESILPDFKSKKEFFSDKKSKKNN